MRLAGTGGTVLILVVATTVHTSGQLLHSRGQNVAPVYEGWEENSDGTVDMLFGYFNRNLDEVIDVPIGPDNTFGADAADRGQPTKFFPRRNFYVFRVKVPAEFGNKELVWTIASHGKTERAYGTLKPDYVLNAQVRMLTVGFFGRLGAYAANKPPTLRIEGDARRTVVIGEPLRLVAYAADDGIPRPKPAGPLPTLADARGLRVAWFVYRGAGEVTFEPKQFKVYPDYRSDSPWTPGWKAPAIPDGGRYPVAVTFASTGTFVLRAMAHDGGLATTQDLTVTVLPR